jgi:hypothetical protein
VRTKNPQMAEKILAVAARFFATHRFRHEAEEIGQEPRQAEWCHLPGQPCGWPGGHPASTMNETTRVERGRADTQDD